MGGEVGLQTSSECIFPNECIFLHHFFTLLGPSLHLPSPCLFTVALHSSHAHLLPLLTPQASDEDSPPNNQITYSIVQASAFQDYFDIAVSEGYGGKHWSRDHGALDKQKQQLRLHLYSCKHHISRL